MPRQGYRAILDETLFAITVLSVMGGLIALGSLRNISRENRALIILIGNVGTFGGVIRLMFVSAFWKRLRKIWLEAMATWKANAHKGVSALNQSRWENGDSCLQTTSGPARALPCI